MSPTFLTKIGPIVQDRDLRTIYDSFLRWQHYEPSCLGGRDDLGAGHRAARKVGADFKPAILAARYHRDTDRVELVAAWCTLLVDRLHIEEFRALSPNDLETVSVSDYGIHVSSADIDINSAGLLAYLAKQIEAEAATSL